MWVENEAFYAPVSHLCGPFQREYFPSHCQAHDRCQAKQGSLAWMNSGHTGQGQGSSQHPLLVQRLGQKVVLSAQLHFFVEGTAGEAAFREPDL